MSVGLLVGRFRFFPSLASFRPSGGMDVRVVCLFVCSHLINYSIL